MPGDGSNETIELDEGQLDALKRAEEELIDTTPEEAAKLEKFAEDQERVKEETETAASIDALTGFGTRKKFESDKYTLASIESREHNGDASLSVIMIDLNNLKDWNEKLKFVDSTGSVYEKHKLGDLAIQAFSQATHNSIKRSTDIPYRYGGDEVVVLMLGSKADSALSFAQRLKENLDELPGQDKPAVKCCVGLETIDLSGHISQKEIQARVDQAILHADKAADWAKKIKNKQVAEGGPNGTFIETYRPEMEEVGQSSNSVGT